MAGGDGSGSEAEQDAYRPHTGAGGGAPSGFRLPGLHCATISRWRFSVRTTLWEATWFQNPHSPEHSSGQATPTRGTSSGHYEQGTDAGGTDRTTQPSHSRVVEVLPACRLQAGVC